MQCRYYLNGMDAFRLKLLLPVTQQRQDEMAAEELKRLSLSNDMAGPSLTASATDVQSESDQQSQLLQHRKQGSQTQQQVSRDTGTDRAESERTNDLLQRLDALRT